MNQTFYGIFKFLTELLISTAIIVWPLKRRKLFVLRLALSLLVCYGFSRIYSYELSRIFAYAVFRYIMLFTLVCAAVWVCFRVRVYNAVFIGISAYAVQFFTNKLYEFLDFLVLSALPLGWEIVIYIVLFAACYAVMYLIFGRSLRKKLTLEIERKDLLLCYIALICVTIILNVVITLYITDINIWTELVIAVYGMVCAIFILCLQTGIFRKSALKSEMQQMEHIRNMERRQMEVSKATIDLINVKCHDMKNMIASYGKSISGEDVKELQSLISVYDNSVKTGNATLDLIIAEKSPYMQQQKITFTCMADGVAINFMRPGDIYSLFGNALNNAVEAAVKMKDESMRVVSLGIKRSKGMVCVHMENYFDGELESEDGRFKTSKGDESWHGFGTKSMLLITEKYGGSLTVKAENNIFKLDIAFIADGAEGEENAENIYN